MLGFELKKTRKILEMLGREVRSKRFALAAFLVPVFIRSIPEILVGPYPIGWDTIAFYVPNTLDWATGKAGFTEILGTAPLMYMISVPVYLLSRVNPVWIFKVMGPILYGTMIWALFRFLRTGLKWADKQALGGALLTSLYFVTLRISWDLYRNMLGLTFILLSLPMFGSMKERRTQMLLAGLVALAVASDQLTGVIALSLIGSRSLVDLMRKRLDDFAQLVKVGVPCFLFFLSVAYAGVTVTGVSLVHQQATVTGLDGLIPSAGFLGYIYLPIAPLVLLGLRGTVNVDLRNWTVVLLGLALTALLPSSGFVVMSYRWSLLLDIPLCVFASAGVARILSASRPVVNWAGLFRGKILPMLSVILVVLAALYIAVPAQNAMLYYATFPGFLPTSMVQDTVPISDMASLRMMLNWVQANMRPGTVLITHQAIYGWARAYLPPDENIVNYRYSDPLEGVKMAVSDGYSSVLMIWWANGSGWHGQHSVPSGFVPVSIDGNMAVYAYY
jgi:hypothetical protein